MFRTVRTDAGYGVDNAFRASCAPAPDIRIELRPRARCWTNSRTRTRVNPEQESLLEDEIEADLAAVATGIDALHAAHVRLAHCLADRFGIGTIVLVDLDLILLCHKLHNSTFSTSSWRIDECSRAI
jgi:hypothetical protein